MTNVEQLEKGIAGLRKITFRAVLGKTQGKLSVCPARSKSTGRLMGVANLSDDQKKVLPYVVNEETTIDIFDGFELNLDNEIDSINWEWIKHLPELVSSVEISYETPQALFYIENVEKDTEDRIKARKVKTDAFQYLNQATAAKKVEICRLLGIDADTMKPVDIDDYLGEIADSTPKKIVNAFEDKLIKVKLFLYRLTDMKIITIDSSGVYSWGNKVLGVNEGAVLIWLQLNENAAHIKQLYDLAYPKAELTSGLDELDLGEIPGIPTTEDSLRGQKDAAPDPLIEQLARDEYEKLFGKKAGNMSLTNILKKITEEKERLAAEAAGKKNPLGDEDEETVL